jgi:hypothetical protein
MSEIGGWSEKGQVRRQKSGSFSQQIYKDVTWACPVSHVRVGNRANRTEGVGKRGGNCGAIVQKGGRPG